MPNPGDLITVDQAKAWLKVTSTDDDVLLQQIVSDASAFIPNTIGKGILSKAYVENYTGNGKDRLILRQDPITAVTSVKWLGETITAAGDLYAPTNGVVIDGKSIVLVGYEFPLGCPVQVSYTAGYATVPFDIQQCAVELVGEIYRRRTHIGETSHAAGGNTTVSFETLAMHKLIQDRLQNYFRVAPV